LSFRVKGLAVEEEIWLMSESGKNVKSTFRV
jgi:hypothetical protein